MIRAKNITRAPNLQNAANEAMTVSCSTHLANKKNMLTNEYKKLKETSSLSLHAQS